MPTLKELATKQKRLPGGGEMLLGDNLPLLKQIKSETVSLIYIDPPFNTGKKQSRTRIKTTRINGGEGDRTGFCGNRYHSTVIGKSGYADSFDDFTGFLQPRLQEAHRILKPNGSLFFHIDWREAANCRLLLEEIFGGSSHCINEIIWAYDFGGRGKNKWPAKHDNIYWFAKDPDNYIFNYDDIDRIPYMAPGLVSAEKAAKGKKPTDVWGTDFLLSTDVWWQTIVPTNGKERVNYATQKPLDIVKRIVVTHSKIGDTVLDFFAGSGTLGEAAKKTRRKYILIDSSQESYEVVLRRLNDASDISDAVSKENCKADNIFDHASFELKSSCKIRKEWQGSPYEWLHIAAPATKGKKARELVTKFLSEYWVKCSVKPKNEIIEVNDKKMAVKLSFLWESGAYTFEQIKKDKEYDYLFLLGISPFKPHGWIISKDDAIEVSKIQHSENSRWLKVHPTNKEKWPECFKKKRQNGDLEKLTPELLT